ncbi:hypothetical protein EMPS_03676 [Entomortierella parvispora]|uniref:3'-5' exonuclease domain-containing protein n=1 Tax=Entomortierella parvispora TaxID=205924 RepID=A0A9P3H779_9FUNG|nr:hypothetical protein EMPS_03676 [Entomortierella parvispora]
MSTLNGNAKPFHSATVRGSISSQGSFMAEEPSARFLSQSNVRVLPHITAASIARLVKENNAFLFAQNLLVAFRDLAHFNREVELGKVDDMRSTVAMALQSSLDPASFIASALIAIGTMAGYKELNKDFELEISKLLADMLGSYIDWHAEQIDVHSSEARDTLAMGDTTVSSCGSGYFSDVSSNSNPVSDSGDLIDITDSTGISKNLLSMGQSQNMESSYGDLLDGNSGEENYSDQKTFEASSDDLIDLSNWDNLESDTASCQTHSTVTPATVNASITINLSQLDNVKQFLDQRRPGGKVADLEELLEIFDEFYSPAEARTETVASSPPPPPPVEQSEEALSEQTERSTGDPPVDDKLGWNMGQDRPFCNVIHDHHREKLLKEIEDRKNAIPVYAAMDVYDLRSCLELAIPEGNQTYGEALARQLFDIGRPRECATVVSKYLGHTLDIDRELFPRLLEGEDWGVVLDYVDNNLGLCRTALSHINHQLMFQFYYWGLVTSEITASDPETFLDIPPIRGVGKPRNQARLVDTAMALIMRFDLEEEQETYVALHLFVQFCMIVSLLEQSSYVPHPVSAPPPKEAPKYKVHEYSLHSPRKFFPIVMGLIKGCPTLQKMTLQYCTGKRDHVTADYFVSRLNSLNDASGRPIIRSSPEIPFVSDPVSATDSSQRTGFRQPSMDLDSYRLDVDTKVVMVDSVDGLRRMMEVLQRANVLGIDTEWLPNTPQFRGRQRKDPRTAILQISSDAENTVYLVDTIIFSSRPDLSMFFVEALGGLFNDESVLKIAYDWDGDQDLLENTFPALREVIFQLNNFLDLKQVWLTVPTPSTATALTSWSITPFLAGMKFVPGGLSGLLARTCEIKLDKTQQCSHWEQRPLTEAQKHYAAADAQCLLKIYSVLQMMRRI